jgi:hypothetical protein
MSDDISSIIDIRADPEREQRKGVPEIILGETKEPGQIIAMARSLLSASGRAIISRVQPGFVEVLRESFQGYTFRIRENSRAVVIYRPDYVRRSTGGLIGVISAGTSDIPVAEEAALVAEEMGCTVTCIYDVGVAGLHRLMEPLRNLLSNGVDVIIVAAGMDGALPSVVAGLVPVPVIGLPTSIGYGMGGKGVAALLSMLQTCVQVLQWSTSTTVLARAVPPRLLLIAWHRRENINRSKEAARCPVVRMSHRFVCWESVVVRVLEGRDFLWQITNADQNLGHKRRSEAARPYVKSTAQSSIPKSAKRVAKR